jgi:DNA-binding NarL/FixJ family response regulator
MNTIQVLLVDDHLLVRSGIKSLLADQKDILIAGEASSGEEALEFVKSNLPDVILMDISMPGISGLQAAEIIKKENPGIKIIMLTMHEEKEYIYNVLKLKVNGILHKSASKNEITEAIRVAASGERYLGRSVSSLLADHFLQDMHSDSVKLLLTKREKEILSCVAANYTTAEIAEHLCISPRTVDTHRSNIIQKYNLKNSQGLYKFALDYVNPPGKQ